MILKQIRRIVFALLATGVGLYPSLYFIMDRKFGLLNTKTEALLLSLPWNIGFYTHIVFGGLALLVGWTQFSATLRARWLPFHRWTGRVYVFAALLSATAAVCIACYATGGWVPALGFGCLGITWWYTTFQAYRYIRQKDTAQHQVMMIYSYAACFAAVTLRLWLPLLTGIFHDFIPAYRIVAWLCWVPNLAVAHFFVVKPLRRLQPV